MSLGSKESTDSSEKLQRKGENPKQINRKEKKLEENR